MYSTVITVVLTVLALTSSIYSLTPQTIILKCCRDGEELSVSTDLDSEWKCIPSNIPWKPFIYSPSKKVNYSPCIILDDGKVMRDGGSGAHVIPSEYCADSKALLICMAKKTITKVYRCCGENAVFHEKRNTCENQQDSDDSSPLLFNISSTIDLIPGFPPCRHSDNITIIGGTEGSVLQRDGGLTVDGIFLPPSRYCVERMKDPDGEAKVFACSEYAPQRPESQNMDIRFMIYPVSIIISAIFLAATLATGCLLPASHHVLHWRCQTHHVVCLMLGDLLMAIIQLASSSLTGRTCKAVAIMAHFFFLGAFFWLNTMCFNIWWTFRDLRPATLEKGQETLRLRVYACYAWGGPLLVAGLAAFLDHLPEQRYHIFLRPRFGEKMCWFYGDAEILAYFYGPIGVLLAINIIFFIATARELTCGVWKGEFVKSTTERAALGRVCLKLVIVMGVTWIADVISWAVGGPEYLWYFTDLVNALQGVFIFIVVGWQPQVRAGLKRLFNKNPRTNAGRHGNGLSTTSHGMPSIGDSVTPNPSTKTGPMETIC